MKIAKFEINRTNQYGVVKDDSVYVINGNIFSNYTITDKAYALKDVKLLAPVSPSKAVCIGINYSEHIQESNEYPIPKTPVVFLKPSTTVIGTKDAIKYPDVSTEVHYEGELAVVIKKEAKDVIKGDALNYVLGFTCANDVSARDWQANDGCGQWTMGKSFDTFLPLGPWIDTEVDVGNLDIKTYVNGEVKQSSNTRNLIFDVATLISYITQVMTLLPGDLIVTGTPAGVGPINKGDEVVIEIQHIGRLVNPVV